MKTTILSLAALALLASSASAQVTRKGSGYLLRTKYTKGKTLRYATSTSVATQQPNAQPMKLSVPLTMVVQNVQNGIATIQLKMGAAKMGNQVLTNGQSTTVKLNSRNVLQGANASAANASLAAQFPANPVKVGQSWTASAPISGMGGGGPQNLKATYTFRGIKTVGGRQIATITYRVSGAASGSGSMTLLATDGTLFSNTAKLAVNAGPQGRVNVTSTLKRA